VASVARGGCHGHGHARRATSDARCRLGARRNLVIGCEGAKPKVDRSVVGLRGYDWEDTRIQIMCSVGMGETRWVVGRGGWEGCLVACTPMVNGAARVATEGRSLTVGCLIDTYSRGKLDAGGGYGLC